MAYRIGHKKSFYLHEHPQGDTSNWPRFDTISHRHDRAIEFLTLTNHVHGLYATSDHFYSETFYHNVHKELGLFCMMQFANVCSKFHWY